MASRAARSPGVRRAGPGSRWISPCPRARNALTASAAVSNEPSGPGADAAQSPTSAAGSPARSSTSAGVVGPAGNRAVVIGPSSPAARQDRKPSCPARLAVMTSDTDSNPEDEYADDEYADYNAENREEPLAQTEIPIGAPEGDVLEQHQDVGNPAD